MTVARKKNRMLDAESVVVKAEVASRQMDEERSAAAVPSDSEQGAGDGEAAGRSAAETGRAVTEPAGPAAKTRFYGRVSLEPVRMLRDLGDLGDIADAIVAQLGRADAEVTISVEIEANAEDGFEDDVRRTVSENARTLEFETHEFED